MREEHHHAEEAIKLIFRGLLPLALFVGGVIVLGVKIGGWGLLLGIPLTVIGAIFLIYTFDDIARATILPRSHFTSCSVCDKPTPVIPGVDEKDTICSSCKRKVAKGIDEQR